MQRYLDRLIRSESELDRLPIIVSKLHPDESDETDVNSLVEWFVETKIHVTVVTYNKHMPIVPYCYTCHVVYRSKRFVVT